MKKVCKIMYQGTARLQKTYNIIFLLIIICIKNILSKMHLFWISCLPIHSNTYYKYCQVLDYL